MRRVVHRFDFDERPQGNFDPVPMHWEKVERPDFPGFTVGEVDDAVGREASPAFRLAADGRNVAYWYRGPATTVRPNSEYLVIGWIRADRLASARATLCAYYLDRQGLPIAGTQVFGTLIGGDPADTQWHRVRLHLPPGPRQTRTIGLTAWVVQPRIWDQTARPYRHIEDHDIEAGAWFDDITIYRMPSAVLSTPAPGNIFTAPHSPILHATVADNDATALSSSLTIRSIDGSLVHQADVPVQTQRTTRPAVFRLSDLPPGLYDAVLRIQTGGETVVTRQLRFAQLAAAQNRNVGVARPFGITLHADHRAGPQDEQAYLSALAVGAVKIPVWSGAHSSGSPAGGAQLYDALLHELVKSRVTLTGVLETPPAGLVQSAGKYARSLLEILADDPEGWRPHLAPVAAAYASVFRSWQIGSDGDRSVALDPLANKVLRQVREQMTPLITTVSLTIPGDVALSADEALPAEEITVLINRDVHDDWIEDYLQPYRELHYERLSAHIELPPTRGHARLPRLANLAKDIIRSRHAGIDTIYLPQLWHTRYAVTGRVTEPTEDLLVYRTIVDLLRDLLPGPVVELEPGVVALAFHDVDSTVLALWDPAAPPEGNVYDFQVGAARRQIDLWGRSTPLANSDEGRRKVRLYQQPVFIDGMERWLVEFAAGARITPDRSELSLLPQTHLLELNNTGDRLLAGRVTLQAPDNWEVRPSRFAFQLSPNSSFAQPIELRYGHNEPAGPKQIVAQVDFESEPRYHLELPLILELGIEDVDVWALAFIEGGRLVLRHGVTNRSARPLSFRSFATVPGRSRQFRVVPALPPGETLTSEYRFDTANKLAGRMVRLGLREVNGTRNHTIELAAP